MAIFGVLKPNKVLTDVEEIFIQVAQNRNHQAYVFTAKDVCFTSQTILGKTIEHGKIIEKTFSFPDVIQNRLAVKAEDKEVYLKLAEIIPFTSNRIGTKKQVEAKLSTIAELQEFLIEVQECNVEIDILNSIEKYNKIILKPNSSNQGKGIYTVEKTADQYHVKFLDEAFFYTQEELSTFLSTKILNKSYTLSPYFKSFTNNGLNTVFRLQINRGTKGQWQLIKFFPYININTDIDITNGMQGALITTREKLFLEQFYTQHAEEILKKVNYLFKVFPLAFQKKYAWRLDSLGLDLGIDQAGNIAIFEVNAGPGIGFMAYPVAKAQVDYYEWLKDNAVKPFKNNFLPLNLRS
ncbi:YheC/YheD family protein [uncultured Acinetobacter sp.]|uniref:YheC/YheD family protein n=1 Tax=uncultured Acinetobacter sp. TaxID=165433 RepID=UPI00261546BF|nr:YheC/YheD family protein [uncultured Acinetobacter sp.]